MQGFLSVDAESTPLRRSNPHFPLYRIESRAPRVNSWRNAQGEEILLWIQCSTAISRIKSRTQETDEWREKANKEHSIKTGLTRTQRWSAPALLDIGKTLKPRITLSNRLRSGYHRIWYEAPQAWWWSRGTYRETPSMTGLNLSPSQCVPTEKLAEIYRIRFELGSRYC